MYVVKNEPLPTVDPVSQHLTWMRLRGLSPATITQRRRALARLTRAVGPLLDATERDLARWQERLTGSPRYLANQLANCSAFYVWACDVAELIPTNPARRLVRPKIPRSVPRPMAEERLQLAIMHAPPDIRCWLVLGAYAGLRAGEMARLQRQDVLDTAETPVLIVDGKGGKQRVVPASPRVLFELRAYGMPSRGYVFRRRDGNPGAPTPARVSQLVNGYLHDLGVEDTGQRRTAPLRHPDVQAVAGPTDGAGTPRPLRPRQHSGLRSLRRGGRSGSRRGPRCARGSPPPPVLAPD